MSPKKRNKENKSLPKGWRFRYGMYLYRVPKGAEQFWEGKSEFKLGKTLHEAHQTFAERVGYQGNVNTMAQLCDRYALEALPKKAPATQRSNQYSLLRIRKVFCDNAVKAIQPHHIYQYRDHTGKTESEKKANLDLEVLSHMFTKAIEWGLRPDHPMTGKKVVKFSLQSKDYVPPLEDISAFAATLPAKWQLYVALKVWTGRRKGELLRLERRDIVDDGMKFKNNKPPYQSFLMEWEPETREIVGAIQALPGNIRGMHLFHTREGKPYIDDEGKTSGFDSIWQRHMVKAVESGIVTKRFTEHDLRKVRASQLSEAQAQELLQHSRIAMTRKYRTSVIRMSNKK